MASSFTSVNESKDIEDMSSEELRIELEKRDLPQWEVINHLQMERMKRASVPYWPNKLKVAFDFNGLRKEYRIRES